MQLRASFIILAASCVLAGCATEQSPPPQISDKGKLDLYEAAIRYRLARAPLARGRRLFVYVNGGAPPGLAKRFPEYDAIIRSGSQGDSPPRERYYFLNLGRVARDKAFVYLEAAVESGRIFELRRRDQQWVVVHDERAILH